MPELGIVRISIDSKEYEKIDNLVFVDKNFKFSNSIITKNDLKTEEMHTITKKLLIKINLIEHMTIFQTKMSLLKRTR